MCLQAGNTYSRFIGNNAAAEKKKKTENRLVSANQRINM
jgi:hypothetical protein